MNINLTLLMQAVIFLIFIWFCAKFIWPVLMRAIEERLQGLQPRQRVAGGVGVERGERAVVAGVHRLEHVQRFARSHFADDDPVRTHTQRIDYEPVGMVSAAPGGSAERIEPAAVPSVKHG